MPHKIYVLILTVGVLVGAATLLAACNTTKGASEDLSAAGQAISTGAEQNKGY
jgi:predicted small secreted protein